MFKNKVGRPSNEVIKKRRILNIVLMAIIFVVLFALTYVLTNITTKKLTGGGPTYYGISCEEGKPCYEAGFRNGNLYQRVIDSYNSENNASLVYEDVITDEQLLSITRLSADEGSIDDATGIEKLVNLEYLYLSENNLTSIDLSSLTKLQDLDLNDNNLTSIDLSNLTNLEKLYLSNNNFSTLDLSNNHQLTKLNIMSNTNLTSLNLSNLTNLEELYLANSFNIKNLDLNDCYNIKNIDSLYYPSIINNNPEIYRNLDDFVVIIPMVEGDTFDLSNLGITEDMSNNFEYDDDFENQITVSNNIINANDPVFMATYYDGVSGDITIIVIILDNLESNKYYIDNHNGYIYVNGNDSNEEILNNINTQKQIPEILEIDDYNYNFEDNKLKMGVHYLDDDGDGEAMVYIPLKSFTIGRIDLSGYEVNEKEITVNGVFNYEEVPHDNVELEYINNTLIVKDLNGNEVDRYTVVGNNDPGAIDPEPINPGNNNGNQAPNNNNENNNVDNNTNNNNQSNNNNNNQNTNDNNKVIEKENVTSKKTTLNKFENNAKTYDDIVKYFIIGGIAVVLIVSIIIYKGKKK